MIPAPSVIRKPKALRKGSTLAYFAPASPPSDYGDIRTGILELQRLGFKVIPAHEFLPSGYFAGSTEERLEGFLNALGNKEITGLIALRGGYGSTYLLDRLANESLVSAKCLIGYSDLTALQIYLWQKSGWVTFHGPMLAAGFGRGADGLQGYDESSFMHAVANTKGNWPLNLSGEVLVSGEAEGTILGGCLTILQTSLGTPWEIDTAGAILLLEDTQLKPYQVDRALMHLMQSGKMKNVRGIILGDFPGSEPASPDSPSVRCVCERVLGPLGIPIIYGAAVGHTKRPMLTIPLGIRARLQAKEGGTLQLLEPAVVE
ncbi:MAG TPA: LD-carboxypeptidase [Candidatus Sulfotelmatobacter sp.]|nr:LD-carboxypeptidase [Candidatus Sulfotelmatobacter sp.]